MIRIPGPFFYSLNHAQRYLNDSILMGDDGILYYIMSTHYSERNGLTVHVIPQKEVMMMRWAHVPEKSMTVSKLSWKNLNLGYLNVPDYFDAEFNKHRVVRSYRQAGRVWKKGLCRNNTKVRGIGSSYYYMYPSEVFLENPLLEETIKNKYPKYKPDTEMALSCHWAVDMKGRLHHFFHPQPVGTVRKGIDEEFSYLKESFEKEVPYVLG